MGGFPEAFQAVPEGLRGFLDISKRKSWNDSGGFKGTVHAGAAGVTLSG